MSTPQESAEQRRHRLFWQEVTERERREVHAFNEHAKRKSHVCTVTIDQASVITTTTIGVGGAGVRCRHRVPGCPLREPPSGMCVIGAEEGHDKGTLPPSGAAMRFSLRRSSSEGV